MNITEEQQLCNCALLRKKCNQCSQKYENRKVINYIFLWIFVVNNIFMENVKLKICSLCLN